MMGHPSSAALSHIAGKAASLAALLLPERSSGMRGFWYAIAISAFLGALYGALVHPFWAEAVAFAQVWTGQIDYRLSPWGTLILADPSLQITIPALLLQAGADPWVLSQALCGFFSALAFAAVSAVTFLLTRHTAFAVFSAVLMIGCKLMDSHGYPAFYPMDVWQFGQTGQYLCLLGFALLAAGFPLAAGIAGGLLCGVHASWALCFVLSVAGFACWHQRADIRRLAFGFTVAFVCAVLLQSIGVAQLPEVTAYEPRLLPELPSGAEALRGTFTPHNVLFSAAASPVIAVARFLMMPTLFAVASLLAFRTMRRDARYSAVLPAALRLILLISGALVAGILFKIYEEIDPAFQLFSMLHAQLPSLILRGIFNRWLNLSTLMIPLFFLCLLYFMVRDRRSFMALLALAVLTAYGASSWSVIAFHIAKKENWLNALLFVGLFVSLLWGIEPRRFAAARYARLQSVLMALIMGGFIAYRILHYSDAAIRTRSYAPHDLRDGIVATMKQDAGPLLLAPSINGIEYIAQIRTMRPVILPAAIDVPYGPEKQHLAVYCYRDASLSLPQFYATVRTCFEGRIAREWRAVAQGTGASGLVTPDDWKIDLPLAASGGGLNYYRLAGPASSRH